MNRTCMCFVVLAASLVVCSTVQAQSPGVLYTWDGTGDIQDWKRNFGATPVTLQNTIAGELTIIEGTGGTETSYSDGSNRRLETSTASGGLDLTGLDFLEFDLGHNGAGNVDVQFYIQGSQGFTFVTLAPDVAVSPGVSTYQLPLSNLTFEQQVYIRTIGFTPRDHSGTEGNLTWTLEEVRSGGTPLIERDLATHDAGASDGGLQGVFANFDQGAILGNDGGQNQTGFSQSLSGSGSLQWTDLGVGPDPNNPVSASGAAIAYGNGTSWNGNSFNERLTDVSNYRLVTYRMSATDPTAGGGTVDVQAYFQTGSGFTYQTPGTQSLPIDGSFYDLTFPITSITDLQNVQFSGVNLGSHANDIDINIDLVRYSIPEPSSLVLLGFAASCVVLPRRAKK